MDQPCLMTMKFFDVGHLFCICTRHGNLKYVWNCNLFTQKCPKVLNNSGLLIVDDYLKVIYDEIEMLSLKGIELLCNKRKKLKIHGLGTRLIVFGVLIEPFPRFCRTFYITYINACTKFPSPMLMSPFFWHNQILAAFQIVHTT